MSFTDTHPTISLLTGIEKVNFCAMDEPTQLEGFTKVAGTEREGLERMARFNSSGRGYAITHATRPSTISLVLMSNPLALLAWCVWLRILKPKVVFTDPGRIGEKFLDWSGQDIPIETILESVTLYLLTDTLSTSLYTYRAVR